jgi:hypothetical protein
MNIAYKNYKIVQTKSLNYDLLRIVKREVFEKDDKIRKLQQENSKTSTKSGDMT